MSLDRAGIPGNLLDRVLELERRLDDLTGFAALPTVDPGSGEGDVTYVEILQEVDVGEGPGIDVTGSAPEQVVGVGLDSVLLSHGDGTPAEEYATITLACAAAGAGDTIWLAPGTYAESVTVPAGVTVRGISREDCVITGQVTLSDGSALECLSDVRSVNDAGDAIGISGPGTGTTYLHDVCISVTQEGSGNGAALIANAGAIWIDTCVISGVSVGGAGYGIQWADNGNVSVKGGSITGSTADCYGGSIETVTEWPFDADLGDWAAYFWSASGSTIGTVNWDASHGHDANGCVYAYTGPAPISANQRKAGVKNTLIATPAVANGDTCSAWFYMATETKLGNGETRNVCELTVVFTDATSISAQAALDTLTTWDQAVITFGATEDGKEVDYILAFGLSNSQSIAEWYIDDIRLSLDSGVYDISLDIAGAVALSSQIPPSAEPLWSERSAWNVELYGSRHASDIHTGTFSNHVPVGGAVGHVPVWDGDMWVSDFVDQDYIFNVMDYGATGDGTTDDTASIQAAMDAAGTVGGIVLFPPGKYAVTTLTQTRYTTMRGSSVHPQQHHASPSTDYHFGTWLYCSDIANPVITTKSGCAIEGLSFFYPDQAAGGAPTVYVATITLGEDAGAQCTRVTIRDCFFQNPYYAINGLYWHEMLTIEDCQGYPLAAGITLGVSSDIDRITRVHWNPNCWREGEVSAVTRAWVNANGTAFQVGQVDWARITNCFAYGYNRGMLLHDSSGAPVAQVLIQGCGFDGCRTGIMATGDAWGVKIIDTDFAYKDGYVSGAYVAVDLQNTGDVEIANCRFWLIAAECIKADGPSHLTIIGNTMVDCATYSSALRIYYYISLEADIDSALIIGNTLGGNSGTYVGGIKLAADVTIDSVTITGNYIEDFGQDGILLNVGPDHVICTHNNLQNTSGLTDSLGTATKSVGYNIIDDSMTPPALDDHDHSGDAGDGGTFDAANLTSGASTDGQFLASDGAGHAAWETPGAIGQYRQFAYVVSGGDFEFVIDDDGKPVMALQELE